MRNTVWSPLLTGPPGESGPVAVVYAGADASFDRVPWNVVVYIVPSDVIEIDINFRDSSVSMFTVQDMLHPC
jgi:hypothetical protein